MLERVLGLRGHNAHGLFFFFFNDTATTEIYTLSLHDALPISRPSTYSSTNHSPPWRRWRLRINPGSRRSEEHTSELQSLTNLVCRLLLEKKKKRKKKNDFFANVSKLANQCIAQRR